MVLHKEQKVLSDQVCSACHCIIQLGGTTNTAGTLTTSHLPCPPAWSVMTTVHLACWRQAWGRVEGEQEIQLP